MIEHVLSSAAVVQEECTVTPLESSSVAREHRCQVRHDSCKAGHALPQSMFGYAHTCASLTTSAFDEIFTKEAPVDSVDDESADLPRGIEFRNFSFD